MRRRLARLNLLFAAALGACTHTPPSPPDPTVPGSATYLHASQRISAVVITDTSDIRRWISSRFALRNAPDDADGGSATPITADGYFLTADHVLNSADGGRSIYVVYGCAESLRGDPARIVWRSARHDLALLKAPFPTPRFYQWTRPQDWVPAGTPVIHAGIATGFDAKPGTLDTSIHPDNQFAQHFKHDIPLRPGDSGGAVLDARGRLVGINSAVKFLVPIETAFFIESEANRPSLRKIHQLIDRDRSKHPASGTN